MSGAYKYRPQYTQNTVGPSPEERTEVVKCKHERLNEEGICRKCGADCRGIGAASAEAGATGEGK